MTTAPKSTLFLGDLATFCTEEEVQKLFSQYGDILEIKIMRSEETMRNLSYGFVKFSNPAHAKRAMNALDGSLFCGRHLRVGWAAFRSKKDPKLPQHHDRIESASVHISYISYQLRTLITEESLRILFSTFGVVLDCSIKKSYVDNAINRQCGYGFVHYPCSTEGVKSALAAAAALNDQSFDDISYKCSISHNLEKQMMNNTSKIGGGTQLLNPDVSAVPLTAGQAKSSVTSNLTTPVLAHYPDVNSNGFPRTGYNNPLYRNGNAGMSVLSPSPSNSAIQYSSESSPIAWIPALGAYDNHHQHYQQQRHPPIPQSQVLPLLNKQSVTTSQHSSRRTSPINSVGVNGSANSLLNLPRSMEKLSSNYDFPNILPLSLKEFDYDTNHHAKGVPLTTGLVSSKNGILCDDYSSALHEVESIRSFPSLIAGTFAQDSDTACSVSSGGRYSLFSDSSVGPFAMEGHQSVATPNPSLPPLGVPIRGFYDDLLNVSTDSERDSLMHYRSKNLTAISSAFPLIREVSLVSDQNVQTNNELRSVLTSSMPMSHSAEDISGRDTTFFSDILQQTSTGKVAGSVHNSSGDSNQNTSSAHSQINPFSSF